MSCVLKTTLLSVTLCLAAVCSSAHSAVLVSPGHDANIQKSSAGSTFNATSITLKVGERREGNARIGYFKFQITSDMADAGNHGTLNLTSTAAVSSNNFNLSVYALNPGEDTNSWTESGDNRITWDNAPGLFTTLPESDPGNKLHIDPDATTTLYSSPSPYPSTSIGQQFSLYLGDNWRSYVDDQGWLTLILAVTSQASTGPSFSFASDEYGTAGQPNAYRPTLGISTVPEPSRTLLLGTALGLALLRRRRQ